MIKQRHSKGNLCVETFCRKYLPQICSKRLHIFINETGNAFKKQSRDVFIVHLTLFPPPPDINIF
jgi:hypothetical protein